MKRSATHGFLYALTVAVALGAALAQPTRAPELDAALPQYCAASTVQPPATLRVAGLSPQDK